MSKLLVIAAAIVSSVALAQADGSGTRREQPSVSLTLSRQVVPECEPVWPEYHLRNASSVALDFVVMTRPSLDIQRRQEAAWVEIPLGLSSSEEPTTCAVPAGGEARACMRLTHLICTLVPGDYRLRARVGQWRGAVEWASEWCDLRILEHAGNRKLASSTPGSESAMAWSMFLNRSVLDGWINEAPLIERGWRVTTLGEYEAALTRLDTSRLSPQLASMIRIEMISLLWARAKRGGPSAVATAAQGLTEVSFLEGRLEPETGAAGANADLLRLKVELTKIAFPGQAAIAEQALQAQVPGVRLLEYARSR